MQQEIGNFKHCGQGCPLGVVKTGFCELFDLYFNLHGSELIALNCIILLYSDHFTVSGMLKKPGLPCKKYSSYVLN